MIKVRTQIAKKKPTQSKVIKHGRVRCTPLPRERGEYTRMQEQQNTTTTATTTTAAAVAAIATITTAVVATAAATDRLQLLLLQTTALNYNNYNINNGHFNARHRG